MTIERTVEELTTWMNVMIVFSALQTVCLVILIAVTVSKR